MTISMYQASVPVIVRALTSLDHFLTKAEADANDRGIDPAIFLAARLSPDMHPLTRQVQIATDGAKSCIARLAGIDLPSFPDTETSFAELHARIAKTLDFVKSASSSQIDGTEDHTITLKFPGREMTFQGQAFLLHFILPNLFFHVITAYAILRHNGVKLGKMDFLGGF
jgi:hypothetical protein